MIDFVVRLAEEAGRLLRSRLGALREGEIALKGRVDLVTRADREAEEHIVQSIRRRYPDHAIMAEESAGATADGTHIWIIDPLDGTTNFVHGFPFFAVSLALLISGRAELGVVHAPELGETFRAVRGQGAFVGERRIRVSRTDRLISSLLATGFAYDRWERERNNLEEFARLTMATRGVRRTGAASLDLAYVAAGRLDGFWEMGLKPWDVAAGALLVQEAGGRVTDLAGGDGYGRGEEIVATNGELHDELLAALAGRGPADAGDDHSVE